MTHLLNTGKGKKKELGEISAAFDKTMGALVRKLFGDVCAGRSWQR